MTPGRPQRGVSPRRIFRTPVAPLPPSEKLQGCARNREVLNIREYTLAKPSNCLTKQDHLKGVVPPGCGIGYSCSAVYQAEPHFLPICID